MVSRSRPTVRILALTASAVTALAACSGSTPAAAGRRTAAARGALSATRTPPPSTATTPPPATTTTTVDPGTLPQTSQLPSASDPSFQARAADLWQAVLTGNVSEAAPAFFPLSAYIQVKGISDPVHDYQTRLIPDYDSDITALHAQIGSGAVFQSVTVPDAAEWIKPGVEYNKGSYWRVYGTTIHFLVGGQPHYFTVASMISWRGQWYVVHLSSIR